jgi:hypothetical protein
MFLVKSFNGFDLDLRQKLKGWVAEKQPTPSESPKPANTSRQSQYREAGASRA